MPSTRERTRDRARDAWTVLLLGLVVLALVGAGVFAAARYWPRDEHPSATDPVPAPYRALVLAAGRTCPGIPAPLLAAQIEAESGWEKDAVSPAGAQGLAQFTPATWVRYGRDGNRDGRKDPFEPADAIAAQAVYMCALQGRMTRLKKGGYVEGDIRSLTLAAYNAGPEAVVQARGMPEITETRAYVVRIERLLPLYEGALASPTGPAST